MRISIAQRFARYEGEVTNFITNICAWLFLDVNGVKIVKIGQRKPNILQKLAKFFWEIDDSQTVHAWRFSKVPKNFLIFS